MSSPPSRVCLPMPDCADRAKIKSSRLVIPGERGGEPLPAFQRPGSLPFGAIVMPDAGLLPGFLLALAAVTGAAKSPYQYITGTFTWLEAGDRCRREGRHLVALTDSDQHAVMTFLRQQNFTKRLWTGLSRRTRRCSCDWSVLDGAVVRVRESSSLESPVPDCLYVSAAEGLQSMACKQYMAGALCSNRPIHHSAPLDEAFHGEAAASIWNARLNTIEIILCAIFGLSLLLNILLSIHIVLMKIIGVKNWRCCRWRRRMSSGEFSLPSKQTYDPRSADCVLQNAANDEMAGSDTLYEELDA